MNLHMVEDKFFILILKKMQVTFVAHRGFAPDSSTIYYIATDASVKKVADDLGVVFVNKTGLTLK